MAVPSNAIAESRDELTVPPISTDHRRSPSLRTLHFLNPSATENPNNPSLSLSRPPPPPSMTAENLIVSFNGWLFPHPGWKEWIERLAPKHREAWERAGILEAIMNSKYRIFKAPGLIIEIAKKWSPETNTFVFGFAEATVSLEDVMVAGGYPVLGRPVFEALDGRGGGVAVEVRAKEKRLEEERIVLVRTRAKKASHNAWLRHFMAGTGSGRDVEHEAFLSLWLSRFVFPGGAKDTVTRSVFPLAVRLARGTRFALGPPVLAGIYRDLTLLRRKMFVDQRSGSSILGGGGGGGGGIVLWSPFQLVLVWIWERFLLLQPERNSIVLGEPWLAYWHEKKRDFESEISLRVFDLNYIGDYFLWRPYAVARNDYVLRRFYRETGERRLIGMGKSDEDFESYARCLRPSELVGVDHSGGLFMEKYLPNRVTRQFGFDQDVPEDMVRRTESLEVAWESYNKVAIRGKEVCFPSRFFTPGVTPNYLEWWEKSNSRDGSGVKSVERNVKIKSGKSDRKTRPREENGGPSPVENVARNNGNPRDGGYVPKVTFERVILHRETGSNIDGRIRLREEINGEPLYNRDIFKKYGNIQGPGSGSKLTIKPVFGPSEEGKSACVKKRLREENGGSSHVDFSQNNNAKARAKGYGVEDMVRLQSVLRSIDMSDKSVNSTDIGELIKMNSTLGFELEQHGLSKMSRLQFVGGKANNGIVIRDNENDDHRSCPPGFSQKHGNEKCGPIIIDLEDNLAPNKMPRLDQGIEGIRVGGVRLREEDDLAPPPGFHCKYGHAVKGGNEEKSKTHPPKMIGLEGIDGGGKLGLGEGSGQRASSPLGFWQNWTRAAGSEGSAEGVGLALDLELAGSLSEDSQGSYLIELNEAAAAEGLHMLGVEMIRAGDMEEKKKESEVLVYIAETGEWRDVDDLDRGNVLATPGNLASSSDAGVEGRRAIIPDLNI